MARWYHRYYWQCSCGEKGKSQNTRRLAIRGPHGFFQHAGDDERHQLRDIIEYSVQDAREGRDA